MKKRGLGSYGSAWKLMTGCCVNSKKLSGTLKIKNSAEYHLDPEYSYPVKLVHFP
jgi:hypothetical protein